MVISCAFIGPRHSPYSYHYSHASDIATVATTINVFTYHAVWTEHRARRRADALYVMSRTRFIFYVKNIEQTLWRIE